MARVLFLHTHARDPVGTTFRWQVEIRDFGKLFLQDRHEHFVQRHAENSRFVRRAAGIGAVVDRLIAVGDTVDGEHREAFLLVVVTGVITERPFQRFLARVDMPLQYELGTGRYLEVEGATFHQLGLRAA